MISIAQNPFVVRRRRRDRRSSAAVSNHTGRPSPCTTRALVVSSKPSVVRRLDRDPGSWFETPSRRAALARRLLTMTGVFPSRTTPQPALSTIKATLMKSCLSGAHLQMSAWHLRSVHGSTGSPRTELFAQSSLTGNMESQDRPSHSLKTNGDRQLRSW